MTRRTLILAAALALLPALRVFPPALPAETPAARLPAQLSGQEFWRLSTELSEPDGYFGSDNLVSNELLMQRVIPELTRAVKPGRAYVGVGPEQNFTYMVAVRPGIAFIVDIRRGNLHLHLMYKALFHLSADRAEFVSRLFSMKRPARLGPGSTAQEIFTAFGDPQLRQDELFKQNLGAIRALLEQRLRLGLPADDMKGIESVYGEFYARGPGIHYEVTPGSAGAFPTYAEMMSATDGDSVPRSFLASEERFATIRELQTRNLVVPVVGNFAGPKSIRAIGGYLRSHDALVSAFYVSNVEQYLAREGQREAFCESAAALPQDDSSTFIRSERGGFGPRGRQGQGRAFVVGFAGFTSQLYNMQADLKSCRAAAANW
jgi:hypothetical protein